MSEQAKQVFYVQHLCSSKLSMVLQGRIRGVTHENQDSTLDFCDTPFSTHMSSIQAKHEVHMVTPPSSPPQDFSSPLESTSRRRRTRQCTQLKRLVAKHLDPSRPVVHVNLPLGKLHTHKVVPKSLKDLIWDDILHPMPGIRQFKSSLTSKFIYVENEGQDGIPCNMYGLDEKIWEQFSANRKTPSQQAQECQKHNMWQHVLSRGGYDLLEKKLMAKKMKKRQEESIAIGSSGVVNPPSPIKGM
ncbi:hypothetical protein GmHk_04G010606 [Glycine max]|nr:hypothetical protein GmHk_04G010606 [Glycine max]